jgi:uncharacterized protein YneF (UPF0154 family)
MNGLPLPVIIGSVMIVAGLVLGIYVVIKATTRNKRGSNSDPLG